MPKPSLTIESIGSFWYLDETEKMYCRVPKSEGVRWSPVGEDWGGATAGFLQDLVWHPYLRWEIHQGEGRLHIEVPDLQTVSAPITKDLLRRYKDMSL